MIRVNLKFFGPLRDIVDTDDLILDLPDGCTGEEAFNVLASIHPELSEWKHIVRLSLNFEYTSFGQTLKTNDEICFIPPVSGG